MTRISVVVLMVAGALSPGPAASLAQSNRSAPPPGTNSAGTTQSSGGAPNREPGDTSGTALGTGKAAPPPMPSGDTVIQQENAILDRKLKSICRGC
jgi:hypothetical protein